MAGKAGRPTGASDARERLIEEARRLFVSLPYSKVSTRMIAARADVNVALIRYYFGHKAGLYETMLRETMAPIQQQLQTMMTQGDFASIVDLLRTYYRIMAPNPDMPKLVARAMMMDRPTYSVRPWNAFSAKRLVPLLSAFLFSCKRRGNCILTSVRIRRA
ncbi:transcriptional regulator TetR family [Photobacterium aphoticum]|uniref:Transcriptional regulator TetR family n=1 Tax=Photobacterium aphoticum TaxID=754436 RepID=A0A090RHL4_9GAMM|nr:transcriptional regulator TetR family [Photobacterium aphoticum]